MYFPLHDRSCQDLNISNISSEIVQINESKAVVAKHKGLHKREHQVFSKRGI